MAEKEKSRFVQEMYVPMLEITHYDDDTLRLIAKDIIERYKISSSLVKLFNCHVVDGKVESRERLDIKI